MQGTRHPQLPERSGSAQISGAGLRPRVRPDLLSAASGHKPRPELARSEQAVALSGAPAEPPFVADKSFLGVAAGGSFIAAEAATGPRLPQQAWSGRT